MSDTPFKEGDIIADSVHNEIFAYDDKSDYYHCKQFPDQIRLANNEEKKRFQESDGAMSIKLEA